MTSFMSPTELSQKNPHSLMDALGKITEVRENGQYYNIVMLDGTPLKRHSSDIVSASATKSGSDVELIDPFQLINWKDKSPPDHLYPKVLEEFIRGKYTNIPQITSSGLDDPGVQMLPEQENQDDETGEQKLQTAQQNESPTGLDIVLQKLIDPTIIPEPLNVPESLTNSKRPRNKRKNKKIKSRQNHNIIFQDKSLKN